MSKKSLDPLAPHLKIKNGYIFYDRLKNSNNAIQAPFWRIIYQSAMTEFDDSLDIFNNVTNSRVGQSLINRGYIELEKEVKFLKEITGTNIQTPEWEEYPKYINTINNIIGLKDDYANLLKLIQQKSHGKNRAVGAMSYLDGYLTTELSNNLHNFLKTKKAEQIMTLFDSNNQWEKEFDKIFEKSLEDAIKKIANQTDYIDGEEVKIWKETAKLLDKTQSYFSEIKSIVGQRYKIDKVSKEIYQWDKERRARGQKGTRGLSTKIKNSYGIGEREKRSIAGLVEEYVSAAFEGKHQVNEKGIVFSSNVMRTDAAKIYSSDATIDLDKLTKQLNLNTLDSGSLLDASHKLESFYNNYLKKLPETFVVYESTKSYSMGDSFRGFHGGGKQPLTALPAFLDEVGANVDGQTLINLLYNTVDGTIQHDRQSEIKDNISLLLSEYMASYLFDDWASIGDISKSNIIHIFNLDGVRVPLSYLLIAMGKATEQIKDSSTYLKTSYQLPKQIKWPNPIGKNEGDEPFDKERGILSYWDEQKEIFHKEGSFSIKFLSNFKTLIKQLLASI